MNGPPEDDVRNYSGIISDSESDFGDENSLFYDEEYETDHRKRLLRMFDRDNGGFSNVYQEKVLPKLVNRSQWFIRWLLESDILYSHSQCSRCEEEDMHFMLALGLHDLYQWRCRKCSQRVSVRENSIFDGVKCSLRSALRILYGWVKGTDLDVMANILGVRKSVVGTLYNRAARLVKNYMNFELSQIGGHNLVVLIDVYPEMVTNSKLSQKGSRPILCFSEIQSIPQKFWLHPLDFWDTDDDDETEKVRLRILEIITDLVRPGSALVIPSDSSILCFEQITYFLKCLYPTITSIEQLSRHNNEERPFEATLETIWKKPLAVCEEAQFYNPDYIEQFIVRHMWTQAVGKDSFKYLMDIIVSETRNKQICLVL